MPMPRFQFVFVAIVLASAIATSALAQTSAPLTLNQAVQNKIGGSDQQRFQLPITTGQFLRVELEQQGIDLVLSLISSENKTLAEIDLFHAGRAETLVWLAQSEGNYQIVVAPAEKIAKPGAYKLTVLALGQPSDRDQDALKAQTSFLQAEELAQTNKADGRKQAVSLYETAVNAWRITAQPAALAVAFAASAENLRALNQSDAAIAAYQQALNQWRDLKDPLEQAITLTNLAGVYSLTNQPEFALDHYRQALALFREAQSRSDEAATLNNLGTISLNRGDSQNALDYHTQALAIRRALKDRPGESLSLQNLGETQRQLGEKRQALKSFQASLDLRRSLNNAAGITASLNSLCAVYLDLGEMQKALDACTESVTRQKQAVSLNNLGRAYDLLGAPQEALQQYEQALQLAHASTAQAARLAEARTLNFMGLSHWANGDNAQAVAKFNEALPITRTAKSPVTEAAVLNNLGLVYNAIGEWQKAIESLNQALPLTRQSGNKQYEAYALNNLGFAYEGLRDRKQAIESHQQALGLAREVRDTAREAKINFGLARLERDGGDLKRARKLIEASVEIVEKMRGKLTDPSRRAEYRAATQQYYDLYIDVLMRLHKRIPKERLNAEAFQVSERARARSLLEMLVESNADLRAGAAPEIVERERELQEKLNDKTTEQLNALVNKAPKQAAALARELDQLSNELRDLRNQLRTSNPRYAALAQPQPLTLVEIQKRLLAPNTLLLEYALGTDSSYLWAVTQNSLHAYALPKRGVIEPLAKSFYETLNNRAATLTEINAAARALSKVLLAPVSAQLGNKRLIVVTEGALQFVPFAALLEPVQSHLTENAPATEAKHSTETARFSFARAATPLIVRHEIVSLPSASTLDALRNETANKPAASSQLAVLADPVFESKDERVKNIEVKLNPPAKPSATAPKQPDDKTSRILLKKAAQKAGVANAALEIPRLPFTRDEANAILALAPAEQTQARFDFAATRDAALDGSLGKSRIVHFATHGFLNSLNPELSGLVFSLVNEQGTAQNGYLLAPELYSLRLPATELAVLSACQTGLGKEMRGEGVVGLTRGLMYAGVPRVVVSLWSVNDKATSELMKTFYQGVLARKQRPAAALRSAQIALWHKAQYRNPYYWAAFTLQGEWR